MEESGYIKKGSPAVSLRVTGTKTPSPIKDSLPQVEEHLSKLIEKKSALEELIEEVQVGKEGPLRYN